MHPELLKVSTDNKDSALAWYTVWFNEVDASRLRAGDPWSDVSIGSKARGIVEHDRRLTKSENRVYLTQRIINILENKHGRI